MEIFLIELILWGGLALLFWTMKDQLDGLETKMSPDPKEQASSLSVHFDRPEQLTEPIGSYCEQPIYRHARIAGKDYEFSHVSPPDIHSTIQPDERYVSPGLVYTRC